MFPPMAREKGLDKGKDVVPNPSRKGRDEDDSSSSGSGQVKDKGGRTSRTLTWKGQSKAKSIGSSEAKSIGYVLPVRKHVKILKDVMMPVKLIPKLKDAMPVKSIPKLKDLMPVKSIPKLKDDMPVKSIPKLKDDIPVQSILQRKVVEPSKMPSLKVTMEDKSAGSIGVAAEAHSRCKECRTAFEQINEREVDDISLNFFYKPHTVTLLVGLLGFLVYTAFTRDDSNTDSNIAAGYRVVIVIFVIISVLAFPNGPFTRPHPAVWRVVFGLSVLYLVSLQFILCMNFKDVKRMLFWFDPERLYKDKFEERDYAVNCSNITLQRFWNEMDYFAYAHFAGWVMKAALIRHYIISWYISVLWEITEVFFSHLLPNFEECWWDSIVMDILICNGLGIWVGMRISQFLEMKEYRWESVNSYADPVHRQPLAIRDIPGTRGKLKRAVMQFTPQSWTHVRWLDPFSGYMRVLALYQFIVVWIIGELNTFFLKHIFAVDTNHPINTYRILLIGAMAAPSIRQYYSFVTDPQCNRVGTQCWVYCAISATEALICIKFGKDLFAQTQLWSICLWIVLMFVLTVPLVYCCAKYAERNSVPVKVNGQLRHRYRSESSFDDNHETVAPAAKQEQTEKTTPTKRAPIRRKQE